MGWEAVLMLFLGSLWSSGRGVVDSAMLSGDLWKNMGGLRTVSTSSSSSSSDRNVDATALRTSHTVVAAVTLSTGPSIMMDSSNSNDGGPSYSTNRPSAVQSGAGIDIRGHHRGVSSRTKRQFSDDPPEGTECYQIREKRKCTLDFCVWCTNKWSPFPGAKGFCEWEEKVKELPPIVYDCKKVHKEHSYHYNQHHHQQQQQ